MDTNGIAYPWYDAVWLGHYRHALRIIETAVPSRKQEFIDAFEPLKTRNDFEVLRFKNIFPPEIIKEMKEVISNLKSEELQKQELTMLGRLVLHDHPYFSGFIEPLVDLVSEAVNEEVEPSYTLLSLYMEFGDLKVHMDAPSSKWALGVCIEQSEPWPLYVSQVMPWPINFKAKQNDWCSDIKNNPDLHFQSYTHEVGDGVLLAAGNQWHYRNPIYLNKKKGNFCHLILFQFIPKGTKPLVRPRQWAKYFGIPELEALSSNKSDFMTYEVSELFLKES